jgi:hypothetical protein
MAVRVCATYKRICIGSALLQQQVKTLKNEHPEELEAVLRPQGVEDSIHLAHVGGARPTTSFCCRNE